MHMPLNDDLIRDILKNVAIHGVKGNNLTSIIAELPGYSEKAILETLNWMEINDFIGKTQLENYILSYYGRYVFGVIADDSVWEYAKSEYTKRNCKTLSWSSKVRIATQYLKKYDPEAPVKFDYLPYKNEEKGTLYYYKDKEGNNIPAFGDYKGASIMIDDKNVDRVLEFFPQAKNNLYVVYQGVEFKINNV